MSAAQDTPQQPGGLDPDRLSLFVSALCKSKQEAMQGRKGSGIEDDWIEDEEHYQGIDDANRPYVRSWLANIKSGRQATPPDGSTSTAFLNITAPYVDTAAARVADILLPVDDRCWAIKPTPIAQLDADTMAAIVAKGLDPTQLQAAAQAEADAAAKAMQDEIDDRFTECNWHGEVRQVIEDAARIGAGVLKGPFPKRRTIKQFKLNGGAAILEKASQINAASKSVNPWNLFPDPACGENIHDGSYIFERDYITKRMLRDLLDAPPEAEYNAEAIRACLKEEPKAFELDASGKPVMGSAGQYEMWTFYGQVDPKDLIAAGMSPEDIPDDEKRVDAMALLVNDKLIKVTFNAMDTGEFPYDVLAWKKRPGMPWGSGVGRAARTPQRMLNAGVRMMLDNGALSTAPQIILANSVTPADGKYEVRGKKVWRLEPDSPLGVRDAMASFTVSSTQPELMGIIQFALQMVEQTTGMPSILQGQEPQKDETLGQSQLRSNNASGTLRRLAKRFDDYITKPHVHRYYDWEMQYNSDPSIKGDFDVDVRASSALIERDAQKTFMYNMMPYSKDPAYGMSPYHLTSEIIKSERMDPKRIQVPEEEYKGSQGPSLVDQAKADLMAAQTEREKTTAVLNRVEALFSAINTANLVAANPLIAAPADKTAKSAGFEDQDAAPIVGEALPGTVPQPMPQNTSPMFPPNPPQPDVGAMAGIEGGQ